MNKLIMSQKLKHKETNWKQFIKNNDFDFRVMFLNWHKSKFQFNKLFLFDFKSKQEYSFEKVVKQKIYREPNVQVEHHLVVYTRRKGISSTNFGYFQDIDLEITGENGAFRIMHLDFNLKDEIKYDQASYELYIDQNYPDSGPIIPDTNNGGIIIKS